MEFIAYIEVINTKRAQREWRMGNLFYEVLMLYMNWLVYYHLTVDCGKLKI